MDPPDELRVSSPVESHQHHQRELRPGSDRQVLRSGSRQQSSRWEDQAGQHVDRHPVTLAEIGECHVG